MPLANVIAVPWMTMVIVPVALLACASELVSTSCAHMLFALSAKLLQPLWYILRYMSAWNWSSWSHPMAGCWTFWTATVGVLLLLAPRGMPGRGLGCCCMLPLLFH